MLALMVSVGAAAQKARFESINTAGLLHGQGGENMQLQSLNGLRLGQQFAGIGIGLDLYGIRSMPLVLELRHNLFNAGRTPFVFASGGLHFALQGRDDFGYKVESRPGWIYELGLGYQFTIDRQRFMLGAGYSFKSMTQWVERPIFCIGGDCDPIQEKMDYRFRRLSFRAGLIF